MALVDKFLVLLITWLFTSDNVLSSVVNNRDDNNNGVQQFVNDRLDVSTRGPGQEHSGHLNICPGTSTSTSTDKFNVTWTPRVVVIQKPLQFYADITLANQFDHGKVCLQFWMDDIPDPLLDYCMVKSCDKFIQLIVPYIPQLTCPIPKGFHLSSVYPLQMLKRLPVFAGKFKFRVEVWNEDDVHMMCFTGEVEIQDEEE